MEHNFLHQALKKFGFGDSFGNAMKTPIVLLSSSAGHQAGIAKISPSLFLLAAQLLCEFIKSSSLQGVSIAGRSIIISQLADNTTLFLKDGSQIHLAIDILEYFTKASGLLLEYSKM